MAPSEPVSFRGGGWAGLAAAVLLVGGFALPGQFPEPGAPGAELARFFQDSRERLLVANLAIGAGSFLFIWFLAAICAWLRRHAPKTQDATPAAALALGASAQTLVVASVGVLGAVALQSADAGERLVRLGLDLYGGLVTVAGVGFGLTVIALARTSGSHEALPRVVRRSALPVAVIQFATLPGLFLTHGPFAAGGGVAAGAFLVLALWFVAIALRMIREPTTRPGGPAAWSPTSSTLATRSKTS